MNQTGRQYAGGQITVVEEVMELDFQPSAKEILHHQDISKYAQALDLS